MPHPALLHGPYAAPAGRRLLLLSHHFPPGQGTGALRWQKLAALAAERGWGVDAVTAHPDDLTSTDPARFAELPAGTRVFGVRAGSSAATALRHVRTAISRSLRGMRSSADSGDARRRDASTAGEVVSDLVYRADLRRGMGPRDGVRAWRAWRYFARDAAWARAAGRAASAIAEAGTHRALVTCGPPHMVHLAGAEAAARAGIPFVMDLRDAWSIVPAVPAGMASPLWFALAERYEARAVRAASLVVANTPALRDAMAAAHPQSADRMVAVMNGCDDEPLPLAARDGRFVIAYAGNIYIDRDPRPLFAAVTRLAAGEGLGPDRLGIELVGHVDAFGGVPVAELARREGAAAFLTVHPRLPRAQALWLLGRASVLVSLPQDVDLAIPSKLFEYMQMPAWVLALARDSSSTAQLLRGTAADVVDPADVDAIHAALLARWRQFAAGETPRPINADGRFGRRAQAAVLLDALERVAGTPVSPGAWRAA
jgi:hypothetical protein